MRRVFSSDPVARSVSVFHGSDDGNSFVIETKQDVTDLVEFAKAHYNAKDERTGWKGDWHHVGWIPMTKLFEMQRLAAGDEEVLQRMMHIWLNDPDNRNLRSRPGRV